MTSRYRRFAVLALVVTSVLAPPATGQQMKQEAPVPPPKNRVRMAATQIPITIGADGDQVTVHPGDLIAADGSGVVVVPAAMVGEVVDSVTRIAAMEQRVLREVRAGVPLREARSTHGYNDVARKISAGNQS